MIRPLFAAILAFGAASPLYAQATVTLLDTGGDVGANPALAIGTDGLGLIAYYDATNGDLKVAHCQNVACTGATLSTVDSAGDVGRGAALAIGTDGRGIISYVDATTPSLKAAHCNDTACTSATLATVDAAPVLGQTSVAIGADGLPLIAFTRGGATRHLAGVHCSDAACSAATVSLLRPLTGFGLEGLDTAVAVGSDGLGLIAYVPRDSANAPDIASIAMEHCVDTTCSAVTPPGPVPETAGEVPLISTTKARRPSLAIGTDGLGIVSFRRGYTTLPPPLDQYEIILSHCADVACAAFSSTVVAVSMGSEDAQTNAPLAMSPAGTPWFVRAQNHKIRLAQCSDAACTSFTDTCTVVRGRGVSLARGSDGTPLTAFHAQPAADLGIVHGSDACTLSAVSVHDQEVQEGDQPVGREILVTVSTPPDQLATVHVATMDGSAHAESDYTALSHTIGLGPGQTSHQILLQVLGDTMSEPDEDLQIVLSNPQGLVIGDGTGVVTLLNDDGVAVGIADCSAVEGDSGLTGCLATASLTTASRRTITVGYATASGSAGAGTDYEPATGTLTFLPGSLTQAVTVGIMGDLAVELDETFFVNLSNPVNAGILDGTSVGTIVDDDAPSLSTLELTHGSRVTTDLAAAPGPVTDQDLYRLGQGAYSSWEIVADSVSGDIGPGLLLERLAEDNSTVLQTAVSVGTGSGRAMRWQRRAATPEVRQHIRVQSTSCTTDCGPDDTYRLRVFETTGRVPRFNNGGGQVTVLVVQNATDQTIPASADFWSAGGALLTTVPLAIGPRAVALVNTSAHTALAGKSGSITVTHEGPYGGLVGKAVALEPATGFSFDSPMALRPH